MAKCRASISALCCVGSSKTSIGEIDSLISELQTLRRKLQTDGERIQRDIRDYAELSQQVMQLTTIISESVGNSRAVRRSVDVETCYTSNIDALRARYAPTSKASPDILTRLAVRWRCLSPAERQEATARCANRRLPVSFKALIRRGSRLAVMHANDDSLGVRSASVSGSDAEGRPLEVRPSARPTFFIWSRYDCGLFLGSVQPC